MGQVQGTELRHGSEPQAGAAPRGLLCTRNVRGHLGEGVVSRSWSPAGRHLWVGLSLRNPAEKHLHVQGPGGQTLQRVKGWLSKSLDSRLAGVAHPSPGRFSFRVGRDLLKLMCHRRDARVFVLRMKGSSKYKVLCTCVIAFIAVIMVNYAWYSCMPWNH